MTKDKLGGKAAEAATEGIAQPKEEAAVESSLAAEAAVTAPEAPVPKCFDASKIEDRLALMGATVQVWWSGARY